MSEKKSPIDAIFDIADAALTPLEKVLSKDPAPSGKPQENPVIDVEFDDIKEGGSHAEWEKQWSEPHWAVATDDHWHAFAEATMSPACRAKDVVAKQNRQALEHGKFIVACTSCIIAVSK